MNRPSTKATAAIPPSAWTTVHEGKTQQIEFGRFAALSLQRCGERKSETFAFLGFTHYCGLTRDGRFIAKHRTEGKRLTRKLKALRDGGWRHMHKSLARQHMWLAAALRGHYCYYDRPSRAQGVLSPHVAWGFAA